MPYIVIHNNEQEFDRRELTDSLIIGRAPECGIAVRDILLSRRHCQIEQTPQGWSVIDLGSKNGTYINGERISEPCPLHDGDVIYLGRSRINFNLGAIEDETMDRLMSPSRPLDPNDSLSGTLSGFTLLMPGEGETPENMPCPRPCPKEPAAYQREDVRVLLSAIASSSWDSIYAEARQPRAAATAVAEPEEPVRSRARPARPRSPIDISLQATEAVAAEIRPAEQPAVPDSAPQPQIEPRRSRWKRFLSLPRSSRQAMPHSRLRRELPFMAITIAIVAVLLLLNTWLTRGSKSLTPQDVRASIPAASSHIQPAPAIPISPAPRLPIAVVAPAVVPAHASHRLDFNVDVSRWIPASLVDPNNKPNPQTIQTTAQTAADYVQIFFW